MQTPPCKTAMEALLGVERTKGIGTDFFISGKKCLLSSPLYLSIFI